MLVINILIVILISHQIFFWTFWWQTKEYRRDRWWSMVKAEWKNLMWQQYDVRKWYRPKKTLRGLVLLVGSGTLSFLVGKPSFFLAPLLVAVVSGSITPIFVEAKKKVVDKAKKKMESFKGKVIGVTGSYGKSSTKEEISWVLSKKYKVTKTPSNYNSLIGVAKTIVKNLEGDEDFFVVEMGAYKRGEIKEICNLVDPDYGIITGIGDQHLDLFGSVENIRKAKMELIESLSDPTNSLIADKDFSLREAGSIKQEIEKLSFKYKETEFRLPIKGRQKVRNVIGVIKLCLKLGMTLKEIAKAFREIPTAFFPPKIYCKKEDYVLDDSYNASLESVLSVVDYLRVFKNYKKLVVTPGLVEIGERSEEDHRVIGKELESADEVVVTNRENWLKMNANGNFKLETEADRLAQFVTKWQKENKKNVVLFVGRSFFNVIKRVIKGYDIN